MLALPSVLLAQQGGAFGFMVGESRTYRVEKGDESKSLGISFLGAGGGAAGRFRLQMGKHAYELSVDAGGAPISVEQVQGSDSKFKVAFGKAAVDVTRGYEHDETRVPAMYEKDYAARGFVLVDMALPVSLTLPLMHAMRSKEDVVKLPAFHVMLGPDAGVGLFITLQVKKLEEETLTVNGKEVQVWAYEIEDYTHRADRLPKVGVVMDAAGIVYGIQREKTSWRLDRIEVAP